MEQTLLGEEKEKGAESGSDGVISVAHAVENAHEQLSKREAMDAQEPSGTTENDSQVIEEKPAQLSLEAVRERMNMYSAFRAKHVEKIEEAIGQMEKIEATSEVALTENPALKSTYEAYCEDLDEAAQALGDAHDLCDPSEGSIFGSDGFVEALAEYDLTLNTVAAKFVSKQWLGFKSQWEKASESKPDSFAGENPFAGKSVGHIESMVGGQVAPRQQRVLQSPESAKVELVQRTPIYQVPLSRKFSSSLKRGNEYDRVIYATNKIVGLRIIDDVYHIPANTVVDYEDFCQWVCGHGWPHHSIILEMEYEDEYDKAHDYKLIAKNTITPPHIKRDRERRAMLSGEHELGGAKSPLLDPANITIDMPSNAPGMVNVTQGAGSGDAFNDIFGLLEKFQKKLPLLQMAANVASAKMANGLPPQPPGFGQTQSAPTQQQVPQEMPPELAPPPEPTPEGMGVDPEVMAQVQAMAQQQEQQAATNDEQAEPDQQAQPQPAPQQPPATQPEPQDEVPDFIKDAIRIAKEDPALAKKLQGLIEGYGGMDTLAQMAGNMID